MSKNPIQPICTDENGTIRFKQNKIVRDLLDFASARGFSLNEIARKDYDRDDQIQLAQLIGYSVSGFGDLSYVDRDTLLAVDAMAESGESELEARCRTLQETLNSLRAALREPIAELYGKHPDDLIEEPQ